MSTSSVSTDCKVPALKRKRIEDEEKKERIQDESEIESEIRMDHIRTLWKGSPESRKGKVVVLVHQYYTFLVNRFRNKFYEVPADEFIKTFPDPDMIPQLFDDTSDESDFNVQSVRQTLEEHKDWFLHPQTDFIMLDCSRIVLLIPIDRDM
jgi:hypothetical protein